MGGIHAYKFLNVFFFLVGLKVLDAALNLSELFGFHRLELEKSCPQLKKLQFYKGLCPDSSVSSQHLE